MISLWKKQTVMQDKSWLDQQQGLQTRIEGLFWPLYYHGNQYLATNRHELVLQSLYWQYRSSGDYDKESLRGNQPIYALAIQHKNLNTEMMITIACSKFAEL